MGWFMIGFTALFPISGLKMWSQEAQLAQCCFFAARKTLDKQLAFSLFLTRL
jgi:hypothetical protein